MDYNNFTVLGRLTADPELKTLTQTSLLTGSLAFNDRANNDYSNFIKFNIWGKFAEALVKHLKKGSRVLMSGTIKHERWETDGEKRSTYCLNAEDVIMLDSKQRISADDNIETPKATPTATKVVDNKELESVPF